MSREDRHRSSNVDSVLVSDSRMILFVTVVRNKDET